MKAVAEVELPYERIYGVVTDSAAYCKKAYRDILSTVFPNSTHVLCLAHIVNLAADVFQKIAEFRHVCTLISMIKSAFFLKPGRTSRFLDYFKDTISPSAVKLPPVHVFTRWNSWSEAAVYHASRVHIYEGFYKAEKSK